jgi:hypothetical protein
MEDRCVCCGEVIPEGRQVCPICEIKARKENDCMTRSEILDTAKKTVSEDRNKQYGEPEDNFQKIADYWSVYLHVDLTAKDVGHMMVLFKIARAQAETKADNYIDMAGYAACSGEIAGKDE